MITVTFDSNCWRPVCNPDKFPNDIDIDDITHINKSLFSKEIQGMLSETIFTLEGIRNSDRKIFFGNYNAIINTSVTEKNGMLQIKFSIGPDRTAHPGNNSFLTHHFQDAEKAGLKVMKCPRVAGLVNQDIPEELYATSIYTATERANRFGDIGRRIVEQQCGMFEIEQIGKKYSEHWQDGIANAPESEDKAIQKAIAEWADGDTVSCHFSYHIDYICTRDKAKYAGNSSIFSTTNRAWLSNEYGIKFITPHELAKII